MDSDDKKPSIPQGMIQNFDKSQLKKTDTRVTTEGGGEIIETKDEHGRYIRKRTDKQGYGFVIDQHADLQVGEIMDGLIMGSQDVAMEIEVLEKYKVTHILNLATYVENQFPNKFTYKKMHIMDYPEANILGIFKTGFDFIDKGRDKGCVLVHCNAGVSRAATIVIGYLMKTRGMSLDEAFNHTKSKRPCICPNSGFQVQLLTYEKMLKEERKAKSAKI